MELPSHKQWYLFMIDAESGVKDEIFAWLDIRVGYTWKLMDSLYMGHRQLWLYLKVDDPGVILDLMFTFEGTADLSRLENQ